MQNSRLMAVAIALCLIIGAGIAAETATGPVSEPDLKLEPGMAGITDAVSIPQQINYQGLLTDKDTGEPLEGPVSIVLKLYSGVTEIWTETQTGVGLNNGVFDVLLGSVTPITTIPDAGACSLEVIVDGETMAPKAPLVSVPYAYHADNTCKLQGFPVSSELPSNGKVLTYDVISASWRPLALSGGSDAWVRVGSDSVLYTVHQLGIARGNAGNTLYGSKRHTHVNLGIDCETGASGQNHDACTVSGGEYNEASGDYATVGGGGYNTASGDYAAVAGGDGNAASNVCATVAGGNCNMASDIGATVGGGVENDASAYCATVGGGEGSYASNDYATVGGGDHNTASGNYATVAGGRTNAASGNYAAVAGGYGDTVNAYCGGVLSGLHNKAGDAAEDTGVVVVGGQNNSALSRFSTVGGGFANGVYGRYATVAGGSNNTASVNYAAIGGGKYNGASNEYATVGGGLGNNATGARTTVGGGYNNTASGARSTVGDGWSNTTNAVYGGVLSGYSNFVGDAAEDTGATVCGGYDNAATGRRSYVGGGRENLASELGATVCAGYKNQSTASGATVCGGYQNIAEGTDATVAGGTSNTASGDHATVGGGANNTASGFIGNSTVGGGVDNTAGGNYATVGGGYNNTASGGYTTVAGGYSNTAAGAYSFAAGRRAQAQHNGCFVWGDATNADFASTATNQFLVRAENGTHFHGNLTVYSYSTGSQLVAFGEGLDYAEGFDVSDREDAGPGTVLAVDADHPGLLKVSTRAYDHCVAGIVAGGNGLGSAVRVGAGGFDRDVALAGRVYCNVDATDAGIEPGDLLTTSSTPGHAMKAMDLQRAHGSILGKAMERLAKGQKGQILVLVSLQ